MNRVRLPSPGETDHAALIGRILNGDASAEEELVCLFRQGVLFAMHRRVRDHETARELADDVLMAVVSAARNGRVHDAAKLGAFVYGTARNVANNHLRVLLSRPVEEPLPPQLAAADPAESLEEREKLALMRRGLECLDEAERQILLMTLTDGLKPGEIARQMGLPPEVVRARRSRAIRKLIAGARVGRPAGSA